MGELAVHDALQWGRSLGHGDQSKLYPRSPRLTFDEACRVV